MYRGGVGSVREVMQTFIWKSVRLLEDRFYSNNKEGASRSMYNRIN